MPLRYEDYATQVPAEKLEQELDIMHKGVEKHLVAIAKVFQNLDEVAVELNLQSSEVRDMESYEPPKKRFVNHLHIPPPKQPMRL